jgi:hypothetical protein
MKVAFFDQLILKIVRSVVINYSDAESIWGIIVAICEPRSLKYDWSRLRKRGRVQLGYHSSHSWPAESEDGQVQVDE